MHRLATEGTERGYDVGFTTTTQMPPPICPLTITNAERLPDAFLEAEPPVAFASEWVSDPERVDRKVRGFDPEPLMSVLDQGFVDWLLVKADGARAREFKAPGTDEPVVPDEATHVVPVASVHAVGEPLTEAVVHRPERVAAITALSVGDTITPETIGTVLASPDGGLRHVPDAAAVTPVINKADTPGLRRRRKRYSSMRSRKRLWIYARPRDVVRTRRMPLRRDRVVVIGKLSVLAVRVPAGRDDDGKRISTVRHEVVVWQIGHTRLGLSTGRMAVMVRILSVV